MSRLIIPAFITLLFASFAVAAGKPVKPSATAKPAAVKPTVDTIKQSELIRKLVESLGLSDGLPEKPSESDYLQILGGNRTFKFEAENTYDRQSDQVSVREYQLFGPYSGNGWLHGTTSQAAVHFKVLIPVSGKYTLTASAKGDNLLWSVSGKAFRHNFGSKLTEVTIGQVFIPAGELEFNALLPPDGAVDSFTFTAPAHSPIEPFAGWTPSAPLKADELNEVIAAALGLESELPPDKNYQAKIIEAASVSQVPETARLTDLQLLGKPVSAKWLRAYQTGSSITLPVEIESPAVYRIRMRAAGTEVTAGFGNSMSIRPLNASLDWVEIGTFRLKKGTNHLNIKLPPNGGVDVIEITRKLSGSAEYAVLAKTGLSGSIPVKQAELESAVKSIQGQFKERR